MKRRFIGGVIAATALITASAAYAAPEETSTSRADDLRLDSPVTASGAGGSSAFLDPALLEASGRQVASVQLTEEPVAAEAARGRSAANQRSKRAAIRSQQDEVGETLQQLDPDATEVATTENALNAVFVEADTEALIELADDPRVESITLVRDYELFLPETVPYIGGSAVHDAGFDGTGVTIAVLDSGVDFTHAALGGPGTVEFYEQCYGVSPFDPGWSPDEPHNHAPVGECAEYFGPGAPKVVGGFDFVGELWPEDDLAPNPNPIDFGDHGTHVTDIAAGALGVAPGADVLGVKVCSAISTSCSGVAIIQGIDFALDPDGDGDLSDRADIINMSLGAVYGQAFDNVVGQAVDNATAAGTLTVAAAGNSADKPYVAGTPAVADTALAVAQTNVPSAVLPLLEVVTPDGLGPYAAVHQPWSPEITELIEGPLQYGDGAGGNLLGCESFPEGSLDGLVVLVDRGACDFSLKMANVSDGGAVAGLIGLVDNSDPFAGGAGERVEDVTIPSFMISLADANELRAAIGAGAVLRFDPDTGLPLIGVMVGSSSRGPSMGANLIKPEIGAPGASVSAIAGTGSGVGPFGGTSGASPMVAGSAALLMEAYPDRSPLEVKSVLVNTGDTDILNEAEFFGGGLAPITRIGGGEVRVDDALDATAAAWIDGDPFSTLSFGFHEVTKHRHKLQATVRIHNYSDSAQTFDAAATFRFDDDALSEAVDVTVRPANVRVRPNGSATARVTLTVDPTKLPPWVLNSGANGDNGNALTAVEFDGYVTLSSATTSIHLPWHVLPRAAGDVRVQGGGKNQRLTNSSVNPATLEAYHLVATSPFQEPGGLGEGDPRPDLRYGGYASYPGACGPDGDMFAFAVNTWERQTHANAPASLSVFVDVDGDGVDDFEVFSAELGLVQGNAFADGRNVTWVADLATGAATGFFFTDHQTNSANTVLYTCSSQFGDAAAGGLSEVSVRYEAFDLYFTGQVTDVTDTVTIDLQAANPVFAGVGDNLTSLAPGGRTSVESDDATLVLVRGGAPGLGEALAVD